LATFSFETGKGVIDRGAGLLVREADFQIKVRKMIMFYRNFTF
jgi:hypothetical protein